MQDLKEKTALITGIANKRSIAFSIAKRLHQYGANMVIAYQPMERDPEGEKARKISAEFSPDLFLPLDVTDPASIESLFGEIERKWGRLDILIHSVSGAIRSELDGNPSDISLEGYQIAQHVSAYSLIALARAAKPLMMENGGSIVTMSYIGSQRAINNYNVMGSAKAALEANMRYLAMEMGVEGIRVNAISAGPIRTLSASGIKDFLDLLHNASEKSPLQRNVTQEEVANTAAFLSSSLSSGITGQVLYVDGGYNIWG